MSQEFVVSTLADENDGDFSQGDLSLREAIALSNDAEGDDTITFDSSLNGGTITLVKDQSTGRPTLANAPLVVTDSVTIDGLGADNITIDGDNGGNGIFEIGDGSSEVDVTVKDVTLANGAQIAFFFPGLSDPGGTFFVSQNADLTLKDSVITGSSASIGGAISNYGTVNIIRSTITDSNSGSDGPTSRPFERRGVINNDGEMYISDSNISDNNDGGISNLGTLEIDNSNISNNIISSSSRDYAGGGIDNLGTATITNSNITGNSAPIGSAINNREEGILTVDRSTIEQNSSPSSDNEVIFTQGTTNIIDSSVSNNDGGGNVGIVVESGTTTIEGSTVANNRADQAQSGIFIRSDAEVKIVNSTVADNQGRAIAGIDNGGTLDVSNSTIANNGGGLNAGGILNRGNLNLTSSLVVNNAGTGVDGIVGDISGDGEFTSNGNNLISNGDDANGFVESDRVGTLDEPIDPQLGELQDNGGATQTIALEEGSPAIDAGSNPNNLETDQRGEGFDRSVGNGTDIGAFEVQDLDNGGEDEELIVSTLDDENDGDFSEGDLSLREAISIAESGNTITFDSALSGGTITLALGELAIDKSLSIQGLGAENIIIDADGNSRVFNIDDGNEDTQIDVALNSLAITGAGAEYDGDEIDPAYNGGGIFNSENLEINNADIYNNQTIFQGGGIYSNGTLTVNNSEIYSNSVGDGEDRTTAGGGIYSDGILTVNNSAIYSNSGFGNFGIATGGGITNTGTATINQSTITANSVGGRLDNAGGIENREGDLTITNSTISNNSSDLTSGIVNNGGEVTVTSTIIANVGNQNISGDDFVSGGNNFISGEAEVGSRGGPITISAEGFTNGENGDLVGTLDNPIDPLLGELQDNGGNTPTQALLEGSPAIDAGSNPNDLATDQRGEGFDRTVGDGTDIGAFEVQDVPDTPDNSSGDNVLLGTDGNDRLDGMSGNEFIFGIDGADTLNGDNGNDVVSGGAGDDLINGGNGNDTLNGNDGNDTLNGDRGNDNLFGGHGNDFLSGGSGVGQDILFGGGGHDTLFGGGSSDALNGGDGNDFIRGDNGNDLIIGGNGSDTLSGGQGHDVFSLNGDGDGDLIVDFMDGSDRLQLGGDLTFDNLKIVNGQSDSGTFILDGADGDSIVAIIENVHPGDITSHDFTNV